MEHINRITITNYRGKGINWFNHTSFPTLKSIIFSDSKNKNMKKSNQLEFLSDVVRVIHNMKPLNKANLTEQELIFFKKEYYGRL